MALSFDPRSLIRAQTTAQLRPWAERLATRGVSPGQLDWAGLGLSALAGGLIAAKAAVAPSAAGLLMVLPAALLLRQALEVVSDLMAAERRPRSRRSALLREVLEALADCVLYLPLALLPGVPGALVVLLVVLGLCTEVAGLAALGIGAGRRRDGPMARSDRAIVLGLAGLILALDPGAAPWLPWLLLPAAGLALATIASRLRAALAEVAAAGADGGD
jgi:CDP-diacylglycerol--glycerol-3-phosphate 3-phosphatidyltransferase